MSRESRASAGRCRPHQQPLLGRNARGFRRLRLAPGPRPARHRLAPQLTALRPLRRRATGVAQKRQPGVGCSLAPSPVAPSPGRLTAHESSAARRRRRASRAAALAPFLTRALHQSACLWHRRSSDRWRGRCSAPPSVARAAQSLLRPSVRRAHRVRPRCRRRHRHPLLAVFPTPTLPPWPSSTHTYNDSEASV